MPASNPLITSDTLPNAAVTAQGLNRSLAGWFGAAIVRFDDGAFRCTAASFDVVLTQYGADANGWTFEVANAANSTKKNISFTPYGGSVGLGAVAGTAFKVTVGGAVGPSSDNTAALGSGAARFSTIYAGTGTINTSDAREKTAVEPLSDAEIAASGDLAREIGGFQFLASVTEKGDTARRHIGMTVQRAMEIMQSHGLDPLAYAFICHDAWEAEPGRDAVPARAPEYDEEDALIEPGQPEIPEVPAREAGDRYGFRADELLLFLARGFEARLMALETTNEQSTIIHASDSNGYT